MSKRPKKQYAFRLDEQNAEMCKEIVGKLGLSLPKFVDQVLAGWVAVFQKSGLYEKDMNDWTVNDFAKFYSVFKDARPQDPDSVEDDKS
jgi:hypothetical protein